MNKNLMALAVAGALTAPGLALAQATTSGTNVQIYGLFDVRFDHMKISSNTNQAAGSNIGSVSKQHLSTGAPNRIGFRGTEALGGGMQAFFQVETQVFTDARSDNAFGAATNASLGGRPTFLGIRGGWGDLSAGYQESVYKDVYQTTWSVNPSNAMFGAIMGNGNTSGQNPTPSCTGLTASGTNNFNGVSTSAAAAAASAQVAPVLASPSASPTAATSAVRDGVLCSEAMGSTTAFNRTVSDSISYRSPVFAGFRFSTMLTAKENKEPSTATPAGTSKYESSLGAYSLTWSGGPFSAAAAYESHVGFRASNAGAALPNRAAKDTGLTLGGRFNYGRGLIGAGWERLRYANTAVAGAENNFDLKNWIFQGTFNITASDVLWAGYSKTNGKTNCGASLIPATAALATAATAAGTTGCGKETGAKFMTFGIDHAFSKRTGVYAYWSKIDNNASANYNYLSDSRQTGAAAGVGSGLATGMDSTSYNVGVKHSF